MHDKMIINNDKYLVADRRFRNSLSQSTHCSVIEDLTDRGSGIANANIRLSIDNFRGKHGGQYVPLEATVQLV